MSVLVFIPVVLRCRRRERINRAIQANSRSIHWSHSHSTAPFNSSRARVSYISRSYSPCIFLSDILTHAQSNFPARNYPCAKSMRMREYNTLKPHPLHNISQNYQPKRQLFVVLEPFSKLYGHLEDCK